MADIREKLAATTIFLHWIIAIAIIAMLAMGLYMEELPRGAEKGQLIGIHMGVGLLILGFALVRAIRRLMEGFPPPVSRYKAWEHFLAKLAHWGLLIGTLALPLSGLMMTLAGGNVVKAFGVPVLGPFEKIEVMAGIGHTVHGIGGKVMIFLIVLHVAGAVKHAIIDKDGTLRRMFGGRVEVNS